MWKNVNLFDKQTEETKPNLQEQRDKKNIWDQVDERRWLDV